MWLTAVWVDIDLSHPPSSYTGKLPRWDGARDADRVTQLLLDQMQADGLPTPTMVISTGGGICIKIMLENALPAVARPRWQSVEEHFCRRVAALGDNGATWPVDFSVCEASRILRLPGTLNPRWNAECRITFASEIRHDFDLLADQILPYSREQAREYLSKKLEWQRWDKNRAAAAAAGVRQSIPCLVTTGVPQVDGLIGQEAARSLWSNRLGFGLALFQERGGICEGDRNNMFWLMANAMAYSCTSVEDLIKQIASLHQDLFSDQEWKRSEAVASAGSVINRLKTGRLYKMSNRTFMEKLKVTPDEKAALGSLLAGQEGTGSHNAKKGKWDIGAMDFEPMKGLEFDDYMAETRRRQALAGARSAEVRGAPANAISSDIRAKAVLMKNSGLTTRAIALELGISQTTVSNWTR
jgi:hypothetical protein